MEEKVKRLEEISAESKALKADAELSAQEKLAKANELMVERKEILAEIELHNASLELEADAPEVAQPKAEEEATPDEEEAPAEDAPAEEEAPAEEPAEEEAPAEEVAEPEAIAAAVGKIEPKIEIQERAVEGVPILASSTSGGDFSIGQTMTASDFGAVHRKAGGASRSGDVQEHKFAQIKRFETNPDRMLSSRNSAYENSRIMYEGEAIEPTPLAAAACFCGPFETKKEITSIGLDARPVQDMFRTVGVTGPFNYIRELMLADVAAGVNIWTCEDQDGVDADPNNWKPCVDLTCQEPVTVDPYALVACGRVATFQELSHPELVDDFVRKLAIQYARLAETQLLDQIVATSTNLVYAPATGHGLLWQIEQILGSLAGLSSFPQRINWEDYALVLTPGLMTAIVADQHLRGFTSDTAATRADIVSRLRQLGVGRIVEALDADTATSGRYATAAANYIDPGNTVGFDPCTAIDDWTFYLVPLSSYTVGLSSMVDAGWRTDASLTRQNLVQYFVEGLEFLEKVNDVPSYTVTLDTAANGISSALVVPADCTA